MDKSGFYKELEDGSWLYAANFVIAPSYTLEREGNRESIDGWVWYDDEPDQYTLWKVRMSEDINL